MLLKKKKVLWPPKLNHWTRDSCLKKFSLALLKLKINLNAILYQVDFAEFSFEELLDDPLPEEPNLMTP